MIPVVETGTLLGGREKKCLEPDKFERNKHAGIPANVLPVPINMLNEVVVSNALYFSKHSLLQLHRHESSIFTCIPLVTIVRATGVGSSNCSSSHFHCSSPSISQFVPNTVNDRTSSIISYKKKL